MVTNTVHAVILAAGRSKRINTNINKTTMPVCGQPMILYLTKLLENLGIDTTIVVGYQREDVQGLIQENHKAQEKFSFVVQEKQAGTGHAVAITRPFWRRDNILVMNGDMPLVTSDIIERMLAEHMKSKAAITLAVAYNIDPTTGAYGRIVKSDSSIAIVEARDFVGDIKECPYINAGIYLINRDFLAATIDTIQYHENSAEFYVTDLIKIAADRGDRISPVIVDFDRVRGINTLRELSIAEQIVRTDSIHAAMAAGVRFTLPYTVCIDYLCTVQAGTCIEAGVHILGNTSIGQHCRIGVGSYLKNVRLSDGVTIHPYSVIQDATIDSCASVGPFAHIRGGTVIGSHTQLGNFVEVKNSCIGSHSAAKHLSYLGDASIGNQVNIGAGVITCNYDGKQKHQTKISDNVFIGSHTTLVAPLTVHEGAYTAAGSVITDDVPADTLAIGRSHQVNKVGYAKKYRST